MLLRCSNWLVPRTHSLSLTTRLYLTSHSQLSTLYLKKRCYSSSNSNHDDEGDGNHPKPFSPLRQHSLPAGRTKVLAAIRIPARRPTTSFFVHDNQLDDTEIVYHTTSSNGKPSNGNSSEFDENSSSSTGGSNQNGNGEEGGGDDDQPLSLKALSPPEKYSPVLILPITRRPLFPGFFKTVVIKDPEVIAAITQIFKTQQPYVTAVLLRDEDADQDHVNSMDQVHRMGVFCQITNIFQSSTPLTPGIASSKMDLQHSITAVLYPHRRVRIVDLITPKSDKPSSTKTAHPGDTVAPELVKENSDKQNKSDPAKEDEDTSPQAYLPTKYRVSIAKTEPVHDEPYKRNNQLIRALTSDIVGVFKDIATLNPLFREQIAAFSISQSSATIFDDASKLADFAAAVCGGSDADQLQSVLDSLVIEERLQKALYLLKQELVNAQLQTKISKEVDSKIQKRQREYYLHEQLKGIKKELGLETDGKEKMLDKFREKLAGASVPAIVQTVIDEEMSKLNHLDPQSSEFNVTRNYLDWLTCLPWGKYSDEDLDVHRARKVLDHDHYGLKDVKDRILEFIAVGKLKGTVEGKIICMVGPPGVGKTSIGKSIARALNRSFYRFSVGGLGDVAEIKGHRRTYVGAMPGKMVQALKKVQTENPLILIDEIDKLGRGHQGDPASALLELLDPEQNSAFLDHYLDVPLDLSKVLFVCTANMTETIPAPLLDRMEVIQLSGYVADEKAAIAESYLIPQVKTSCGLAPLESANEYDESKPSLESEGNMDDHNVANAPALSSKALKDSFKSKDVPPVTITKEAINDLIRFYCRESGVRNLKKHIEKVFRKAAFRIVADGVKEVRVTSETLKDFVGTPTFQTERMFEEPPVGVVMGLAWTAMGGSALYIESVLESAISHNSKPGFKTTGQLGDVMKESTTIALTYAKTFIAQEFPELRFFNNAQVHLHVPEGAQPKDGPSAGVTMATALISLASQTPVPGQIAMTGELTLTGKVLKIGGLKEKTIAAKRSGITTILFPRANEPDWEELAHFIKDGITGVPVDTYHDVFSACFGPAVASGAFGKNAWRPEPNGKEPEDHQYTMG